MLIEDYKIKNVHKNTHAITHTKLHTQNHAPFKTAIDQSIIFIYINR